MPSKLIYLLVAIISSFCVSLYAAQPSSFKGAIDVADGILVYANFFSFPHHKLNSTPIESRTVYDEQECIAACTESSQCRSSNFRTILDANGKFLCQLLDTDKFNLSESFNASLDFHHHSLTVSTYDEKFSLVLSFFSWLGNYVIATRTSLLHYISYSPQSLSSRLEANLLKIKKQLILCDFHAYSN